MKRIKVLLSLGIFATLVLAMLPASAVLAAPPTKLEFSFPFSYDFTDLCSFNIHQVGEVSVTGNDYFGQNGVLTRSYWHITEQDTFSANGKTLVGLPYTSNLEFRYDSSGNLISWTGTGIIERIPLPDGSTFLSAGRVDFVKNQTVTIITPDKGKSGNLAAFCAALS